jgi:hypothetical protein
MAQGAHESENRFYLQRNKHHELALLTSETSFRALLASCSCKRLSLPTSNSSNMLKVLGAALMLMGDEFVAAQVEVSISVTDALAPGGKLPCLFLRMPLTAPAFFLGCHSQLLGQVPKLRTCP